MTAIYLIDTHNVYTGQHTLTDPMAPLPRCVTQEPPATQGTQVARWSGAGWEVLPLHPAISEQAMAVREAIVAACLQRLTTFAATRGYSSLESISKYKDITDAEIASLPAADRPLVTRFRTECRYLALATAQTWAVLYRGLAEVEAGTRPMPSGYADIESDLPVLTWPV